MGVRAITKAVAGLDPVVAAAAVAAAVADNRQYSEDEYWRILSALRGSYWACEDWARALMPVLSAFCRHGRLQKALRKNFLRRLRKKYGKRGE